MAKQIYIDENGNPIEVSGTINNASMLPISANDTTDTKSYIDSKTSNLIKYDTVSGTTSGTGALAYSNDYKDKIIACFYPNSSGLLGLPYNRGDGYFTCLDNDRQPRANASVTVGFYYLNI